MAYEGFAAYYDELNADADYDRLAQEFGRLLVQYGIPDGIVADLGCGTGELTLRLARAGYDMIAVDASADMLSVLRQKLATERDSSTDLSVKASRGDSESRDILLLCQPLEELDLFGTIRAAVSSFDTFNHLAPPQLTEALRRIALFMEPDGMLLFDMNTPYKHTQVLQNHSYYAESIHRPGVVCEWENRLCEEDHCTEISLEIRENDSLLFSEDFIEYYYDLPIIEELLEQFQLDLLTVLDGDTYLDLQETSSRMLLVAKKRN